jgi:osmotically-inducible protein OsmY
MASVLLALLMCGFVARADAVRDATVAAKLETVFLFNEHLNPFEIKSSAKDGTVTLEGAVRTQVQKDLAESIAKSVSGVKQVVNRIEVASGPLPETKADQWSMQVNDATVTASVLTRLNGVKDVDPSGVHVTTHGGVVTLSGEVSTEEQKTRIENIARHTRGVRKIVNKVHVRAPAKTADPKQGSGRQEIGETLDDEWMEKRIEIDLALNRNVNLEDIDVEVNSGVATLSGTVQDETERVLAEESANDINGVRQVRNNLRVEPVPSG